MKVISKPFEEITCWSSEYSSYVKHDWSLWITCTLIHTHLHIYPLCIHGCMAFFSVLKIMKDTNASTVCLCWLEINYYHIWHMVSHVLTAFIWLTCKTGTVNTYRTSKLQIWKQSASISRKQGLTEHILMKMYFLKLEHKRAETAKCLYHWSAPGKERVVHEWLHGRYLSQRQI
jgi:hypothetical protein